MSKITNLEFQGLDITGNNYLSWILDAETHLQAQNLQETIVQENTASPQNQAKALIFLRHHLHEGLKNEYLTVKDPSTLWQKLKERYGHQQAVLLPKARHDWIHLRLQDFKTVNDYNSALFNIISKLELCGENITESDKLEKTFSTFHASNMVLQQQYRERRFKTYSELITCLLVAESNNELLMKNHESHPSGSIRPPEANANFVEKYSRNNNHHRNRDHARVNDRKHNNNARGNVQSYKQKRGGQNYNSSNKRFTPSKKRHIESNTRQGNRSHQRSDELCSRCGIKGHHSRVCRTAKHLADLYEASKAKQRESNFIAFKEHDDINHLDVADYLVNQEDGGNYSIGDGTYLQD